MADNNNKLMTNSATFPSPGTPPYDDFDDGSVGIPIGWASERVPLSAHQARRYVAATALMPFSSGRALPSKWDDAERWISSPVSVENAPNSNYYCATDVAKSSQMGQWQRRAKSKSGPLGPAGLTSYGSFNSYSPVLGLGVINGVKGRNSVTIESPGLVRTSLDQGIAVSGGGTSEGGRRSCPGQDWLDQWSEPPSPTHHKEQNYTEENGERVAMDNEDHNYNNGVDRAVSRRDMATQMFPESESSCPSSVASSPRSSMINSSRLVLDMRDVKSAESEVRDVQVDKQISVAPRSSSKNDQKNARFGPSFDNEEADKTLSKLNRQEARINAWENLQKAKAEAAIQKLEMKMEKKRASSMEKIIEKLRKAEIKAHKMRSSLLSGNADNTNQIQRQQSRAISRTTSKLPSFKFRLRSSTSNCSTCYPF